MSSIMSGLAGALGGGGAPPDAGGYGPPEAPPEAGGGAEPPAYSNSLDALDGAEEALHAFIQLDHDEPDRAVAAQCLQQILKLKAANQQSMQSGGDMKGLQRAIASGGPGPGMAG